MMSTLVIEASHNFILLNISDYLQGKLMQTQSSAFVESPMQLQRVEMYLASDPGNRDLLAAAVDLNLESGSPEKARTYVDAALSLYPDDPFFHHRHSNVLIAEGKLDDAEKILKVLHRSGPNPGIIYNLAYISFLKKKYAESADLLLPLLGTPGLSPMGLMTLLRALHHIGDLKKAIGIVEANIDVDTASAELLSAASLLYLDDGQLERAKEMGVVAKAKGPDSLESLVVDGNVSLGLGDAAAAESQFNAALKINPADGRSRVGLGVISMIRHDLPAATVQLEQAAASMPSHVGTLLALGWCKIFSGDIDAAELIYEKAVSLDRNFGESHGGLAVVAAKKGNRELAEEYIRRAQRLDRAGLSARYAQMILSGVVNDPVKFREQAGKLLSARTGPLGGTLGELIQKFARS
ncbi:tetratricopeptide repeat protein [Undibacterium sp. TJN25]|uniref:tetratricopeptide repeat protein n=1 Tax=Undibacterium sp. TJN25 TaxID=3413056 RepID=UPI003BF058EB